MSALLWFLVVNAGLNIVTVFYYAAVGKFPPITMEERACGWAMSTILGVWSLWLLASL